MKPAPVNENPLSGLLRLLQDPGQNNKSCMQYFFYVYDSISKSKTGVVNEQHKRLQAAPDLQDKDESIFRR
jgi:hypothetical protein